MKKLAKELGIKVVWFYGEPGHGRGLVDAMSSFGCKQQLRHEIITNDSWFQNAEEMVRFLQQYFLDDESKEHHLVDEAENAKVRANERGELEIKPCRKFHVIGVNEDDVFTKKLYFTNPNIISTIFDFNDEDTLKNTSADVDDDVDEEPAFSLNQDTVFELVEPGTFVGMRSPQNAIEPFFIVEVLNKGIAEESISDIFGHTILCGEQYAEVCYLQKKDQKKNIVRYQRPKKVNSVYIHIGEIFVTNVALDVDLCMDIYEYQSILDAAL